VELCLKDYYGVSGCGSEETKKLSRSSNKGINLNENDMLIFLIIEGKW